MTPFDADTRLDVAVVGGGIAGLTVAFRLRQAGLSVALFEQGEQPGGMIGTRQEGGFLFDLGPNSTLEKHATFRHLVEAVGLKDEVCEAASDAGKRYVLRGGRLRAVPTSPLAFLRSGLLSPGGKARVLAEVLVPRGGAEDESVAEFVRRRLGQEFLAYVIDPFVAGVFAGDPARLDVRAAFPRLVEMEARHGGLFRGAVARRRAGRTAGPGGPRGRLLSFRRGMQALPKALAAALGSAWHPGTRVTCITPEPAGYRVAFESRGNPGAVRVRRLVLAVPAPVAAGLVAPLAPDVGEALEQVPYAPVAAVGLGYRREQVAHPLDGFGFLVPSCEGRRILGTLWNSSLFPGRAPEGHVMLTTYVGGMRQPALATLPEQDLLALVHDELASVLGVTGAPVWARVHVWPRALPQYTYAYHGWTRHLVALEERFPGLYVVGNYRGGASVSDCVEQAWKRAGEILEAPMNPEEKKHGAHAVA